MSSDIWKIGQETNAQNVYKDIKEKGLHGCIFLRSEVIAVNQLTNMCNQMIQAYDEIINDQNDYLIEIENEATDLENLKGDIDSKIKTLYNEIKTLEKKEQDGTITEEEQNELENKKGELNVLMDDSDAQINEKTTNATKKGETKISEQKSKIAVAKNYGEVTIEKGQPLADTKVSHGFFKKLFGCTGKNKKEAGEKAVEAGTNLLDKVETSTDINKDIETSYKKLKI